MRLAPAALLTLALGAAPAAAAEGFVERNVSRPGATYANVHLPEPSADACRTACGADTACHAWTFVKPGMNGPAAICELKASVPVGRASPCCDSGLAPRFEPGGSGLATTAPARSLVQATPPAPGSSSQPLQVAVPQPPAPDANLLGGPPSAPEPRQAAPGFWTTTPDDIRRPRGPRPLPENLRPRSKADAPTADAASLEAADAASTDAPAPVVREPAVEAAFVAPVSAAEPAPQAEPQAVPLAITATPGLTGWTVLRTDAGADPALVGVPEPAATDQLAPGVDPSPIVETAAQPAPRGVPWYERKSAPNAEGRAVAPLRSSNGVPVYSVTKEYAPQAETSPAGGAE